jgi:hypothetical protein
MDESTQPWIVWSLLPWIVLIAGGSIILWKKATGRKLHFDAVRLETLRAKSA